MSSEMKISQSHLVKGGVTGRQSTPSLLAVEGKDWQSAPDFGDVAIRASNLSKCYQIYDTPRDRLKQFIIPRLRRLTGQAPGLYFREFWALKDVSFEVKRGETVGIIGRNGSGKSTLLQLICGTLSPTNGSVDTNGRIAALLELGSGFNPEFTGRDNVYMNAAILGLSKEEIDERYEEIVRFAGIGDFINQPIKTYSSGMVVRLAFAVNIVSQPNIMIVDEALAVGDMAFQAKCMTALTRLQENGSTILFVSHDVGAVKSLCSRAVYLESGSVKMIGKAPEVAELYIRTMREEMNVENRGLASESPAYKMGSQAVENNHVNFGGMMKRSQDFESRVSSFRYGSGGARITYVELLDMNDQLVNSVNFNQEVKIVVYLEVHEELTLAVSYGIMDDKKNLITGGGLRIIGMPFIEAKGRDQYVVTFKTKLPLAEGNYAVMAQLTKPIIADQAADFIDVVDDAIVFSMSRRNGARVWPKVYLFPTCKIHKVNE